MFYALAEDHNDSLANKLEMFIALAPITLIGRVNQKDIFTQLSRYVPTLKYGTNQMGIHEFFVQNWSDLYGRLGQR